VYDIGANVGFFTLLASKLAGESGTVVSFEPVPRNLAYLERHVRANKLKNVRVLPIAVSSRAGRARFATASNPAMGGLVDNGELEVQTDSLDGLVASGQIPAPAFMKIDVEGAELDVLAGAAETLRSARPTILLSAHGYVLHERCWSLLERSDFELTLLRDGASDGNYVVLAKHRARSSVKMRLDAPQ
jgi:FkbM family methyltransferase